MKVRVIAADGTPEHVWATLVSPDVARLDNTCFGGGPKAGDLWRVEPWPEPPMYRAVEPVVS